MSTIRRGLSWALMVPAVALIGLALLFILASDAADPLEWEGL